MGSASFQPKWWTEKHGSQWENVKEAMKRDWEQTKKDLHVGGKELNQNAGDTVKQATGKEAIPSSNAAGTRTGTDLGWDDAEQPLMYGVGARQQYGAQHATWNEGLELRLKSEWEAAEGGAKRKWDEVKNVVRHGYDKAARR
ncbi:MAG: hypothetical protein QOI41_2695 [Myxococcales bacterium]|nr:hypothetical protein [Myxococcales bacterium]